MHQMLHIWYGSTEWKLGLVNGLKLLGAQLDSELQYKKKFGEVDLQAAQALQRMRALVPRTVRHLFGSTVAPVIDYASSIWSHAAGASASKAVN